MIKAHSRWGLLRHQHRIDEVDGGVCGLDSTADDSCVVDLDVVTGSGDGNRSALGGGVSSVDRVRGDLAGNHVVGEDLGQRGAVRLEAVDRGGVDLGECRVDRCEDGELATVESVDQVDVRVELAGDRRGLGGEQRIVGRRCGNRILGHSADRSGAARHAATSPFQHSLWG